MGNFPTDATSSSLIPLKTSKEPDGMCLHFIIKGRDGSESNTVVPEENALLCERQAGEEERRLLSQMNEPITRFQKP